MGERDFQRADSLNRKLPPPYLDTLQYKMAHASKTKDEALKQKLIDAYEKTNSWVAAIGAMAMLNGGYDVGEFDRLTKFALANAKAERDRRDAQFITGSGLVEQGRMAEAFELIELEPERLVAVNRFINTPFYELPRERLLSLRQALEKLDTTAIGEDPASQMRPYLRLYNLAVVSCRLHDYPAANGYAQRLMQLPAPPRWARSVKDLAREALAQIDMDNGRVNEAVQRLDEIRDQPPADLFNIVRGGGTVVQWKAEALFRARRYEDALRYLDSFSYVVGPFAPHVAWQQLRRAQIQDALGNAEQARLHYSEFLQIFQNADAPLQPIVRQVRNRLAELQQQAG